MCLIRLGRAVGFEKQLEWYDLRRGSGKKLNSTSFKATLSFARLANFLQRLLPSRSAIIAWDIRLGIRLPMSNST
jgi:hypothetical protein